MSILDVSYDRRAQSFPEKLKKSSACTDHYTLLN